MGDATYVDEEAEMVAAKLLEFLERLDDPTSIDHGKVSSCQNYERRHGFENE